MVICCCCFNFFATHCEYSHSRHLYPVLCAAISHAAAVLSAGTHCENSCSAVSKINTAPAFAFTPKQRPCRAHSSLPTSHNTWFPVCKRWFHWLICSETANPTSCYKHLFQVQTTWRKGELSTVPRHWNWFSRTVQMTKLKSTIIKAATRVLKMKIFGQHSWNRPQSRLFEQWRRGNQQWNPAWHYWCQF